LWFRFFGVPSGLAAGSPTRVATGCGFGLPVTLEARIPRLAIPITTAAMRAVRITADLTEAGTTVVEGTAGVVEDIID